MAKLSTLFVTRGSTPGKYCDGACRRLYLYVGNANGQVTKSSVLKYKLFKRKREIGLG
jgi:hypothetical protein